MSLFFAGTHEHALLTFVISEAENVKGRQFLGRIALQKIVYFLKVLGIPMNYRFEIYHYGPFCDEILSDVEILIADNVIKDRSKKPDKYSDYIPASNSQELLGKYDKDFTEYEKRIKAVVGAFAPMRPEELEKIATLHYLYRWVRAAEPKGPCKRKVLNLFNKRKPDRFSREELEKGYDRLQRIGLVEA